MLIYIGRINVKKKYYKVFVSDKGKTREYSSAVIISSDHLDMLWIQDIVNIAVNKNGRYYCDKENRIFLLLYILYSIKMDLQFEDIMLIFSRLKNIPMGTCYSSTLWLELCRFMRRKGYQYKCLPYRMYIEEPRVAIDKCLMPAFSSVQQVKFLSSIKDLIYSKCENAEKNNKKDREYWSTDLKKRYVRVSPMLQSKHTQNCYYTVEDVNENVWFVKCGYNHNIKMEYEGVVHIQRNSINQDLYGLPVLEESTIYSIVYPYREEETLKDVLYERTLDERELASLCGFFLEVIRDLDKCNLIHRDIHIENIRVFKDEEERIVRYQLIDFGWSCVGKKTAKRTIEEYRDCKYLLGDKYRYSTYGWDDAASCVSILLQHFSCSQLLLCWDKVEEIASYIGKNSIGL